MAEIRDYTIKLIKAIAGRYYDPNDDPTQALLTMFEELAQDLEIPLGGDE